MGDTINKTPAPACGLCDLSRMPEFPMAPNGLVLCDEHARQLVGPWECQESADKQGEPCR